MYQCAYCKTPTGSASDWEARSTHIWGNQHGEMIRVFCKACESWTDNRLDENGEVIRWRFVGKHKPEKEDNGWREQDGN